MKSLKQLIQKIYPQTDAHRVDFQGVQLANLQQDSRQLSSGDVFIALQGLKSHGLDYLSQAITSSVACILTDRALTENEQACLNLQSAHLQPVILVVDNLSNQLAELANWFYDQPSKKLKVVGITGTNGKTSTAHYLAQMLVQLGQNPALIGTLGNGLVHDFDDMKLEATLNTTPDVVSVFRLLNQFYQQGANWVVMEVSSHALELGRIEQIEFESVALTQVTRDHLDFHGTEYAYQQAKIKLFTDYKSKHQVLNIDDAVGRQLSESGQLEHPFLYSVEKDSGVHLFCSRYELNSAGIELSLAYNSLNGERYQNQHPCFSLMGAFNIENVLCAMSILLASGFKWTQVVELLPKLTAVNGRMQVVSKAAGSATALVDFAHTPDALQQVLTALKAHVQSASTTRLATEQGQEQGQAQVQAPVQKTTQVWLVFGCGGDRDRGKRPLMAQVAESYADRVVLTSDNPRFEAPGKIIAETLIGFKQPNRVRVIEDRQCAIEFAVAQARPEDVVLIAGKGHENYQDITGIKQPFSDQQVILESIAKHKRVVS